MGKKIWFDGFFSSQKYINFSFTYFYFRIFIRSHQASMTLRSKNHSLGSWGRRQKTVALWVASKSSFFSIFRWIWKVSRNDQNGTRVFVRKLRVTTKWWWPRRSRRNAGVLEFVNCDVLTWRSVSKRWGRWLYFGTYLCFERSGFSLEYFLKKTSAVLPSWLYSAHSQFSLEERM